MSKAANPRRRLLHVERLELRDVPATATLRGTILTVDGTSSSETIVVRQNGTLISVDGTSSQNVERVSRVVVRAGAGNDTVNVATLKIPVTIWGGKGDDRVYLGNGNDTAYGDQGNDTILGSSGNDWLVGGEGNDQVWGGAGNDWITGDNGEDRLSGDNGNDTIAGGEGKDTLAGGSGVDQFDGHGFGRGAADAARNFNTYQDEFDLWQPLGNANAGSVLKKGQLDNVGYLAALGAISIKDAKAAIRVINKGTYDVSLPGDRRTIRVTFDGTWTDNDPKPTVGTTPGFAWILLHRARLISLGIDPNRYYSNADWDALNTKTGGKLYDPAHALRQFTGRGVSKLSPYLVNFATLKYRLDNGAVAVAQSFRGVSRFLNERSIVANHFYVLRRLFTDSRGVKWVELYNPNGNDCGNGRLMDNAPGAVRQNDGIVTLKWDEFRQWSNFNSMYVA
jgi:hypothetical protein